MAQTKADLKKRRPVPVALRGCVPGGKTGCDAVGHCNTTERPGVVNLPASASGCMTMKAFLCFAYPPPSCRWPKGQGSAKQAEGPPSGGPCSGGPCSGKQAGGQRLGEGPTTWGRGANFPTEGSKKMGQNEMVCLCRSNDTEPTSGERHPPLSSLSVHQSRALLPSQEKNPISRGGGEAPMVILERANFLNKIGMNGYGGKFLEGTSTSQPIYPFFLSGQPSF